jgi:hypothetical protein
MKVSLFCCYFSCLGHRYYHAAEIYLFVSETEHCIVVINTAPSLRGFDIFLEIGCLRFLFVYFIYL